MTTCPCCGSPIADRAPLEALAEARGQTKEREVLAELIRLYPRGTSIPHLVDVLYSSDPNGGPDAPMQVVRVYLSRLRRALRAHGWTISSGVGGPGAHNAYRLVPA